MSIKNKHIIQETYLTIADHQITVVDCPEYGHTVDVIDSNVCLCGYRY
jgi:hypothetical protein